jgi:hypothetical protein
MTFNEFLKIKKQIDTEGADLAELMDEHYDEYTAYLLTIKDGCGTDK